MIEMLAAAEEAVSAGGSASGVIGYVATGAGGAAITIVGLLIKRGFSIHVGSELKQETDAQTVVCPAHDGLVKLVDERNRFIHEELTEIKGDVKTLLARRNERSPDDGDIRIPT